MTLPPPRRIVADAAQALVFFTRLPLPRMDFAGRTLGQALWAAPLAGLIVALAAGCAYAAAHACGLSSGVAAAVALCASMAVTGCLHEDGLADVADGFGGGATLERRLEIMRDSRIGTYGAAALILCILLRWNALAQLARPEAALWALIAAHAASRALIPAFMLWLPPARSQGVATGAGAVATPAALGAAALGLAALLPIGISGLLIAIAALAVVFLAFAALCRRQIAGYTGDTLGALQQLGEAALLLVTAAMLT